MHDPRRNTGNVRTATYENPMNMQPAPCVQQEQYISGPEFCQEKHMTIFKPLLNVTCNRKAKQIHPYNTRVRVRLTTV